MINAISEDKKTFGEDIKKAREAYNKLSSKQKAHFRYAITKINRCGSTFAGNYGTSAADGEYSFPIRIHQLQEKTRANITVKAYVNNKQIGSGKADSKGKFGK